MSAQSVHEPMKVWWWREREKARAVNWLGNDIDKGYMWTHSQSFDQDEVDLLQKTEKRAGVKMGVTNKYDELRFERQENHPPPCVCCHANTPETWDTQTDNDKLWSSDFTTCERWSLLVICPSGYHPRRMNITKFCFHSVEIEGKYGC